MNKKLCFTRTVLLGALLYGIAGTTLVGCKDYDDDIAGLQVQIDANKDAIATLKSLVDAGAIVTGVKGDDEGGVIITLSDGTEHHIKNGTQGENGKAPIIRINPENGDLEYHYSDEEPWVSAGKIGVTVSDFQFAINEKGVLTLNGKDIAPVVGTLAVDFKVEDGKLYYQDQDGAWHEIGDVKGAVNVNPKLAFQIGENGVLQYRDLNNVDSEWKDVENFNMENIIASHLAPSLNVKADGYLYVGEQKTSVQVNNNGGGSSDVPGNVYVVVDERTGAMTVHIPQKNTDGTFTYLDVVLPTTDAYAHMITSASFVPLFGEGADLQIWRLTSKKDAQQKFISNRSLLRFLVSPKTLVYGTDYKIAGDGGMECFQTRSGQESLFKASYNKEESESNKDGLVYMNFEFDSEKIEEGNIYSLFLPFEDLHNQGRIIYSNYIKFNTEPLDLIIENSGALAFGNDKLGVIEIANEKDTQVDLNEILYCTGKSGEKNRIVVNDLFDIAYKFELVKSGEVDYTSYFTVEESRLKLNDVVLQAKEASVGLNVSVMIGEVLIDEQGIVVKLGESATSDVKIINDIEDGTYVNGEFSKSLSLTSEGLNTLNTFFGSSVNDVDVNVDNCMIEIQNATGEKVNAKIEGKLGAPVMTMGEAGQTLAKGSYQVSLTYLHEGKNLVATFTLTLTDFSLEKVPEYWSEDKSMVEVRAISESALQEMIVDLSEVFVNPYGDNATFEFEVDFSDPSSDYFGLLDNELYVFDEGALEFEGFLETKVDYTLKDKSGAPDAKALASGSFMVRFYSPVRKVEIKTSLEMEDVQGSQLRLLSDLVMDGSSLKYEEGALGLNLWVDDCSGDLKLAYANGLTKADRSLIFTVPTFDKDYPEIYKMLLELEDVNPYITCDGIDMVVSFFSDDKNISIDGDSGVITWNGQGTPLESDYTFTVTCVIEGRWAEYVKEISVTVKPKTV